MFFAGMRRENGEIPLESVIFFSERRNESVATHVSTPPSEEMRTLASSGRTTDGEAEETTVEMRFCISLVLREKEIVGFSGRGIEGKSSNGRVLRLLFPPSE